MGNSLGLMLGPIREVGDFHLENSLSKPAWTTQDEVAMLEYIN
jgi:hypothetical protein